MGRSRRPRPLRLAEKLLRIRTALGWTQEQMHERLRSSGAPVYAVGHISEFENDKREPPLPVLLEYARAVNVSTDVLIDDAAELPDKLPARRKHGSS